MRLPQSPLATSRTNRGSGLRAKRSLLRSPPCSGSEISSYIDRLIEWRVPVADQLPRHVDLPIDFASSWLAGCFDIGPCVSNAVFVEANKLVDPRQVVNGRRYVG
jgi:hypothetical protein